ncbi:MAG TPA: MFS transporter, partial [Gemmatimonadales bacterium]
MIAAPLSDFLMTRFASPTSVGVWQTFVVMGVVYGAAMLAGAFGFRLPASDWKPEGWTAPAAKPLVTQRQVHVDQALKTPQFYLLWLVLCLNVTAGIGVLGQASPMIQEVFKGRITATAAAGFVGLLSLFNMGGRIFWASLSDRLGRKMTYAVFFTLGPALYALVPLAGRMGSVALFVGCFAVILTMYGGGFATIPAYLADVFGARYVGGIHGRLLTAWSMAGVLGPVLVNYIRQNRLDHGVAVGEVYNVTMYVMVSLLIVAFFCNLSVRAVAERHYLRDGA